MPATALKRRPITVEEFERMARVGILAKSERVELHEGEIVEMAPIGPDHNYSTNEFARRLYRAFSDAEAGIRVQSTVVLGRETELQPDLMLLRPKRGGYRENPRAADVLLIIEVCDSSLAADRAVKLPKYAAAGIPEVWLVDLRGKAIEVHRHPAAGRKPKYAERARYPRGAKVSPLAFPKLSIGIDEIV